MHIVFVTTEFIIDQKCGGLASFTANMATIFAENNHLVTVLVAGKENRAKSFLWKKNILVEYLEFNTTSAISSIYDYVNKKKEDTLAVDIYYRYRGYIIKKKIKEINRKNKVDLIHYCNLLAVGLCPNKNIPYLIRISSFPGMARLSSNINFSLDNISKRCNRLDKLDLSIIKKSKAVISPSNFTADIIKENINKKIPVIESPFYMDKMEWDDNIYKTNLLNKKYVLFYGRLSREKGLHLIDEIIYKFLDEYQDMYFVFIGQDFGMQVDRKFMKVQSKINISANKYADRAVFMKPMPKEKLFPIIQNAYACILPSIVDNLPNTCIEAMALGKVVIGTRGASFEQLIVDGKSGLLCESTSSASLYSAIERLINMSTEQIIELGENAKLRINRLNPQRVYKNYLKYYQYVIKKF